MTTATQHPPRPPLVLKMGTLSGLVCFVLFQAAYWLTTWLSRSLAALSGLSVGEHALNKGIGAALVLLIALAVTYAWDWIRIKYRLDAQRYWTMIGLSLSVCLAAALLSSGF